MCGERADAAISNPKLLERNDRLPVADPPCPRVYLPWQNQWPTPRARVPTSPDQRLWLPVADSPEARAYLPWPKPVADSAQLGAYLPGSQPVAQHTAGPLDCSLTHSLAPLEQLSPAHDIVKGDGLSLELG